MLTQALRKLEASGIVGRRDLSLLGSSCGVRTTLRSPVSRKSFSQLLIIFSAWSEISFASQSCKIQQVFKSTPKQEYRYGIDEET